MQSLVQASSEGVLAAVRRAQALPPNCAASSNVPAAVRKTVNILRSSTHPAARGSLVRLGAADPRSVADSFYNHAPVTAIVALAAAATYSSKDELTRIGKLAVGWREWTLSARSDEFERKTSRKQKLPPDATFLAELLRMWDSSAPTWSTGEFILLMEVVESMVSRNVNIALAIDPGEGSEAWRHLAIAGALRGRYRILLPGIMKSKPFASTLEYFGVQPSAPARNRLPLEALDSELEDHFQSLTQTLVDMSRTFPEKSSSASSMGPLLIAVAATAPHLNANCKEDLRHRLSRLCLDAGFRSDDAVVAVNGRLFGAAAAIFAPTALVVNWCHSAAASLCPSRASTSLNGAPITRKNLMQQRRLSLLLTSVLENFDALDAELALLSVDSLSLLNVPVAFPASKQSILLSARIASSPLSTTRLGVLTSAAATPPIVFPLRSLYLLQILALTLQRVGLFKKSTHTLAHDNSRTTDDIALDRVWIEVFDLLRASAFASRSFHDEISTNRKRRSEREWVERNLRPFLLDACLLIIANTVCSKTTGSSIASMLWQDMVTCYTENRVDDTDLARVLDILVSGAINPESAVACVEQLEQLSDKHTDAEMKRLATVLTMRATLRCDLSILQDVLKVATKLIQKGNFGDIARDAVLHADAVRKDDMLTWYFQQASSGILYELDRPVSKL